MTAMRRDRGDWFRRIAELLSGHTETTFDAAFAPDGRGVVTASARRRRGARTSVPREFQWTV